MLRVADDLVLDMRRFLRGELELHSESRCTLLCPIRGKSLPLTASELAVMLSVPADRWCAASELPIAEQAQVTLFDLASRGLLLAKPAALGWHDIAEGEEELERAQWHDLAAVYHAHTAWHGVVATSKIGLQEVRETRGDPPSPFVRRQDASSRVPLNMPRLDGPFFDVLLARHTTRAYKSQQPLSLSLLESILYAVFGTLGIKYFAEDIAAIKRTSASGGALHPIEAYLLAMNVGGLEAGLYHYESASHALALLESMDTSSARRLARDFTAGQTYLSEAHALVIHVARFDRSFWKYAQHRKGYKAVLMDSAHLSQTFYLTAAHLGLGAFYTLAINDVDIASRLKLPPLRQAAIGINGVGIADDRRDKLRFSPVPYSPVKIS